MKKLLPAILCSVPLLGLAPAAHAENAVALAVQRLHLSPQQLLSLRDFLGAFSRGMAVDASGNGLFVLRDARSMEYAGEFSLHTDGNGTLLVDRIAGPATLEEARDVQVPLRLDAKGRLQASATLSGSEALAPSGGPPAALPSQQIAGAALTNAAQPASVLQSRGVFFRDGSGYTASVRAGVGGPQAAVPPLRIAEHYYAPIKSDGKDAWRSATVEIDGDVAIGFADLEVRYACTPVGPCPPRGAPVPANLHVIRWGRQNITAVPVTLMAQLAPQPQTSSPPSVPPAADATTPHLAVPDLPPAGSDSAPATPQHPSGT